MKFSFFPVVFSAIAVGVIASVIVSHARNSISGAPPDGIPESEVPPLDLWQEMVMNWTRPAGPAKVALQVGHWKNDEIPNELERLRGNTGASGGGHTEVSVNLAIAEKTAVLLRAKGVEVDIIPSTVPPDYWSDAFIAIHADGSTDRSVSGFKIARPWRDLTGRADDLVSILEKEYQDATKLRIDPNITRNMRGYYAFAWWRYDHSIHPMTPAVIVETGFITNANDRKIIVGKQDVVSQALADGITNFLIKHELLADAKN
jgi:hypothetical protein